MRLLLMVQQIIALHLSVENGILFEEDSPVYLYNEQPKTYIDVLFKSPLTLWNDNDVQIHYCGNSTTFGKVSCRFFLKKFDEGILRKKTLFTTKNKRTTYKNDK